MDTPKEVNILEFVSFHCVVPHRVHGDLTSSGNPKLNFKKTNHRLQVQTLRTRITSITKLPTDESAIYKWVTVFQIISLLSVQTSSYGKAALCNSNLSKSRQVLCMEWHFPYKNLPGYRKKGHIRLYRRYLFLLELEFPSTDDPKSRQAW